MYPSAGIRRRPLAVIIPGEAVCSILFQASGGTVLWLASVWFPVLIGAQLYRARLAFRTAPAALRVLTRINALPLPGARWGRPWLAGADPFLP